MYIKVSVSANQKKEKIEQVQSDTYAISVREKAEKNQANIRVRTLLAETLSIPVQNISIVTGHKSPRKILFARDL